MNPKSDAEADPESNASMKLESNTWIIQKTIIKNSEREEWTRISVHQNQAWVEPLGHRHNT